MKCQICKTKEPILLQTIKPHVKLCVICGMAYDSIKGILLKQEMIPLAISYFNNTKLKIPYPDSGTNLYSANDFKGWIIWREKKGRLAYKMFQNLLGAKDNGTNI